MATEVADRYVRTGTTVSSIYPGNLKGLTTALREIEKISKVVPGAHSLDSIYGKDRIPFRIYENGECVWQSEQLHTNGG